MSFADHNNVVMVKRLLETIGLCPPIYFCILTLTTVVFILLSDNISASPVTIAATDLIPEELQLILPESQTDSNDAGSVPVAPSVTSPENNWVRLGNEKLFFIETSIGSQTREARAKEASENIRQFAERRSLPLEALQLRDLPDDGLTEIVAGDEVLFQVSQTDADTLDDARVAIAQQYLENVKEGVARYRHTYSPEQMLYSLGKAALATAVLGLSVLLLNRIFRWFRSKIQILVGSRIPIIRIGSRDLINIERFSRITMQGMTVAYWLLLIGLSSLYANLVLSFFPQTRSLSISIFSSIFSVIGQILFGFISYIPNLIFLVVLGHLTFYTLKFSKFLFDEIDKGELSIPGFDRDWAIPTARITQLLIGAFTLIVAFPYLPGSESDVFQGISIFLGILISLGSSSAISNVIAGIMLTYTRAFRIGDEVEISGVVGTVVEKGLLVTRLCTQDHHFVSIPNAQVLSCNVTNFRAGAPKPDDIFPPPLIQTMVGIGHDIHWHKAYSILLQAASETELVLKDPPPYVLHEDFQNGCVIYGLYIYTQAPHEDLIIRSQLRQKIHDRCYMEGIELLSPQYIAVRNGDESTLPDNFSSPHRPSTKSSYDNYYSNDTATTSDEVTDLSRS